ncbi:MAG: hypothetical protein ABIH82_03285, partial [Candidatus Woesearchaeota archaeon]
DSCPLGTTGGCGVIPSDSCTRTDGTRVCERTPTPTPTPTATTTPLTFTPFRGDCVAAGGTINAASGCECAGTLVDRDGDGTNDLCRVASWVPASPARPVIFTPLSGVTCVTAGGTTSLPLGCVCSGTLTDTNSDGVMDTCGAAPSIYTNSFFSSSVYAQHVETVSEAANVNDNYASWGFEIDSASTRTDDNILSGVTYFKYKTKTYVIDILEHYRVIEPGKVEGKAKLGVKELGTDKYIRTQKVSGSGSSDKISLTINKDVSLTELVPQTVKVDLEGSSEPEFYLHFEGRLGSLHVLATMSPLVDLSLYPRGSMIMYDEDPLQFRYSDGTYHSISYIDTGSDYVIVVDGFSHISSAVGLTSTPIIDNLGSPDPNVGVKITTVLRAHGYAIVIIEPIVTDLTSSYQGIFDKSIRTLTLGTTTYKICNDDPLDLEFTRICNNANVFQFGMNVNTPYPLGTALFYYTYPEQGDPKEVKVYRLLDLSEPEDIITETGYTFSSNLVAGKGLAFKVRDTLYDVDTYDYYLLTLPEDQDFLSFENLIITPLSDLNLQPPLPQSDREKAVFNLPVERRTEEAANRVRQFNVQRVVDEENVKYQLSAQTLNKFVNLKRALQTSVDTFGAAAVYLGEDGVTADDARLMGVASTAQDTSPEFAELFINDIGDFIIEDIDNRQILYENQPTVLEGYEDYLFIYSEHRANRENYHSKKVDIHLLYQLTTDYDDTRHKYTDEDFNLPIMKGYKMGLEVAGNYYLLGYNPNRQWTGTEFFDINELRLTRVGASETITKVYSSADGTLTFTLGNDYKVNLHFNLVDLDDKKVEMNFIAPDNEVTSFVPEEEYEAELPGQSGITLLNILRVKTDSNDYWNCDPADYLSFTTKMLLCDDRKTSVSSSGAMVDGEIVKVMEPFRRAYQTGKEVLITFREAYAGRKTVTFQYIWDELNTPGGTNSEKLSWSTFSSLLADDKNPIVLVDGDYFEIRGGELFNDLTLRNLTSEEDFPIIHYLENEGEDEGIVLVGKTVFTFEENDNLGNVEIKITRPIYLFVNAEGFEVGEETQQQFITKVDAKVKENIYTLITRPIGVLAEQIRIEDAVTGRLLYTGLVPLRVTKSVLLPNGDTIKIRPTDYINAEGALAVKVKISR